VRWDSFDIGANAVVRFEQPSTTSTILNRIEGGLLAGQTTIDGRLLSNGQLYLLNPNGIVFGKTAQVDVGSMVASSLSIDEERFKNGLLSPSRNPDLLQNLFADPASALRPGDVVVEGSREGGVLQQAALTAQKNGFLLLAAPTVRNDGVLRAPDGQVVLAGGTRVYLSAPTDASMRGLRVEIGDQELQTLAEAAQQTAASATNGPLGTIAVGRGNVTLAGMLVNQSGAISANTSLTQMDRCGCEHARRPSQGMWIRILPAPLATLCWGGVVRFVSRRRSTIRRARQKRLRSIHPASKFPPPRSKSRSAHKFWPLAGTSTFSLARTWAKPQTQPPRV
jgi:filamentous hemagglutinin family protein